MFILDAFCWENQTNLRKSEQAVSKSLYPNLVNRVRRQESSQDFSSKDVKLGHIIFSVTVA